MSSTPAPASRRQGKAIHRRGRMVGRTVRAPAPSGSRSHSIGARLRYRFDNALARGPLVIVAYLALLSLAIVLLAALAAAVFHFAFGGGRDDGFLEDVWQSMLRMVDAGTFVADVDWPTRLLALGVTLAGIFLAGSLIGLIANAVDRRVEDLRRGRSPVLEGGHTLILGWSPQVPRIISELIVANESERSAAVVVLAPADKTEMEATLRAQIPDWKTTRIVCRSGNPAYPEDLRMAAADTARSVVVVRDGSGDAGAVKAVLALRALDPHLTNAHVVVELSEGDNARTLRSVAGGRVLTVSSDDVVAEVTAQACLQGGLAAVFTDLLDFDGDEIYFTPAGPLVGRTYRDALMAFDRSSVIGRLTAGGAVDLNPPPETPLDAGDQLIVVAADDSAVAYSGVVDIDVPAPPAGGDGNRAPLHIVIVGWSRFGAKVLAELDEFLPDGSAVEILVDTDLADPQLIHAGRLAHATVTVRTSDGDPEDLLALGSATDPDQVIVLAYRDSLAVDDADTRTLLTLLTLRSVWPSGRDRHVRIVAELLDQRNLVLADPMGVDDLIVSDALTSLLLAQLSERAELQAIFDDLFDADGAVIELRPAERYVAAGEMPFVNVVAAAGARGESAFGYRLARTGAVTMNPPKSQPVRLGPGDQVIVITNR